MTGSQALDLLACCKRGQQLTRPCDPAALRLQKSASDGQTAQAEPITLDYPSLEQASAEGGGVWAGCEGMREGHDGPASVRLEEAFASSGLFHGCQALKAAPWELALTHAGSRGHKEILHCCGTSIALSPASRKAHVHQSLLLQLRLPCLHASAPSCANSRAVRRLSPLLVQAMSTPLSKLGRRVPPMYAVAKAIYAFEKQHGRTPGAEDVQALQVRC